MTMKRAWAGLLMWLAALLSTAAQAGTVTYYHNDLAGSPAVATNSSGAVIWRQSYRPYGERLTNAPASAANDVWFTSRRQDAETGLVYMGARYYDPVAGRFNSVDPKGFDEANVHSFNRYAYANNNPYRYVDPDGQMGQAVIAIGIRLTPVAVRALATLGSGIGIGIYNATQPESRDSPSASNSGGKEGNGDAASPAETGNKGSAGGTRAGKPFTPKGKAEIDAENADRNGGANVCDNCGQDVVPGERSQKGVRPPGNERQRDHIIPQSKGGDGDPGNGQILCRDCNRAKGDKYP